MQKVLLMGMDPRLMNAFGIAFQQQKPQQYSLTTDNTSSTLYVLDADTYAGGYSQFSKEYDTHRALVIATTNNWGVPEDQFIARPLRVPTLFHKLGLLENALKTEAAASSQPKKPSVYTVPKKDTSGIPQASAPATSPASTASSEKQMPTPAAQVPLIVKVVSVPNPLPLFDLHSGVLGAMLAAVRDKRSTTINWKDGRVAVDIPADTVYTTMSLLDGADGVRNALNPVSSGMEDTDRNTTEQYTVENAIWISAYEFSNGRLPQNIQATSILQLRRWPNLTRLQVWPNTIRICAFLARTPCNILILTKMLGVDYQEVFSTVSAMCALDVLTVATHGNASQKPESGTSAQTATESVPVVNVEQRGFLSRIMFKIRGI